MKKIYVFVSLAFGLIVSLVVTGIVAVVLLVTRSQGVDSPGGYEEPVLAGDIVASPDEYYQGE